MRRLLQGLAFLLGVVVGCGADDTGARPPQETPAPGDAGGAETGPFAGNDAGDASNAEAGEDLGEAGAVRCAKNGDPCLFGALSGVCKSGTCIACDDVTDDLACDKAYDTGKDPRICMSGACVSGDCRAHTDCAPAGRVCGAITPNVCGPCANDSQCVAAYAGARPICNRVTGRCVPRADACAGHAEGAPCSDWNDVCCGGACVQGECCPGTASAQSACQRIYNNCTSLENVCTANGSGGGACSSASLANDCAAATGNVYYASFLGGRTGANACYTTGSSDCPFRTDLPAALKALGPNPPPGTTLVIVGPGHFNLAVGSKFPLVVPPNVTITTSGGPVVLDVSAGEGIGVILTGPGSVLRGSPSAPLVVAGMGGSGKTGIVVTSGTDSTTRIEHVVVDSFAGDGILVEKSGVLTIGQGVDVRANGTWFDPHAGLRVTANGKAIVDVPAGATPTVFHDNAGHGILVEGAGSLTVRGVPAAQLGAGTVIARANGYAGLWVEHRPGGTSIADVEGLVAIGNGASGVGATGGSGLLLRKSQSVGNQGSGVLVTYHSAATRESGLGRIDLGTTASPGKNTLQSTGTDANARAGICLAIDPGAGTLAAKGNVFAGGKDCATAAASLTYSATSCASSIDLAVEPAPPSTTSNGNSVDVSGCTHP